MRTQSQLRATQLRKLRVCMGCSCFVTGDATLSLCALEVEFAFRVTGAISPDAESIIKTLCGDFLSITDGEKLIERFERC